MAELKTLFSPITLNGLTLKNRIAVTAHGSRVCENGLPGARARAYYMARAKSASMMLTGTCTVYPQVPETGERSKNFSIWHPESPKAIGELVAAVKEEGSTMFAQIGHAGRQFSALEVNRAAPAPSSIPWEPGGETPRAMTESDIARFIRHFGTAAARVREVGFEGVEIHGAHGYLVHEFLSPVSNHREDDWGGSFDKRCRFPLAVIESVRKHVGPDFVVGLRISGLEFVEGGYTLAEQKEFASRAVSAGLDYINVSAGTYHSMERIIPSGYLPQGVHAHLARAIRESVTPVPVLHAGRITDPGFADKMIESGDCDMVGMLRALLADPDLASKALHDEPIRKCTGLALCWERSHGLNFAISCGVNPEAGRELEFSRKSERVGEPKRVAVVGAGPAGLEAARRLSDRGHQVTVIEEKPVIGGNIRIASMASGRESLAEAHVYYESIVQRGNIDLRLRTRATTDLLKELAPEIILLATGGHPKPIEIEGAAPSVDVMTALTEPDTVGRRVIVYTETNHLVGVSVADTLAESGREVTLITPHSHIASAVESNVLNIVRRRLSEKRVVIKPDLRLGAWDGNTATFIDSWLATEEGGYRVDPIVTDIECDTLITDLGFLPDDSWADDEVKAIAPMYRIGDCMIPRNLQAAIWDGAGVVERVEG